MSPRRAPTSASLKAAGVDHIKVDLTITDEQLSAVIEEGERRRTEGARPHAEHQEGRGHGHEAHGAHGHDGAGAARAGREGPAAGRGRPGSGGQSEALSAAHRLHGEAGRVHQSHAGASRGPAAPSAGAIRQATGAAARQGSGSRLRARRRQGRVGPRAGPRRARGYANIAEFLSKYSEAGGKVLAGDRHRLLHADHSRAEPALRDADAHRHRHHADEGDSGRDALGGGGASASRRIWAASNPASSPTSRSSKAIRWPISARRRTCAWSSRTAR